MRQDTLSSRCSVNFASRTRSISGLPTHDNQPFLLINISRVSAGCGEGTAMDIQAPPPNWLHLTPSSAVVVFLGIGSSSGTVWRGRLALFDRSPEVVHAALLPHACAASMYQISLKCLIAGSYSLPRVLSVLRSPLPSRPQLRFCLQLI